MTTLPGACGVDVEDHALGAADFAQLLDVLHHADFIVDEHHRGDDGVRANRGLELFDIQQAVVLHAEVGHFEALAFQLAHGVQHRLVLGLDRDQVLALLCRNGRCP